MARYTNIALPHELAERIEKIINGSNLGYRTKAEFVKEAVRTYLREVAKFENLRK